MVKEEPEKLDFEKWDFGHLIKECNRCGHKTIMDRDVQDGISMYMPTTDKHELRLLCDNCGNSMRMFFVKSDKVKPPEEKTEIVENKGMVVEEKRRKKIKKDAVPKGSKKEKSVSTDSKGS